MDKTTHEIRLANWKQLIEQCNSRPKDQTAKQWIEEHNISEKQYYYWLRKIRAKAYGEMESKGLMAPAMPKGSETVFAEIPCRRVENITPLNAPAAVIHKSGATIACVSSIKIPQMQTKMEKVAGTFRCLTKIVKIILKIDIITMIII